MSPLQIAAAIAAVLIAVAAVWKRERLSGERKLLAAGVVLALGVYASGVLSAVPDPKAIIDDIARALGPWTYALVGVMAYLETGAFVGLVAPGETVVIAGGVIAGQGEIDLIPLIGLVWTCAVLGDSTSFYLGHRLGRGFLERHGPRVKITPERLTQVEDYFHRHGGKTILIGRFIGLVRALAPFIAGSSRMPYRRFIPYSIVGTGLWATTFCVLGYIFWRSFDQVAHIAGPGDLRLRHHGRRDRGDRRRVPAPGGDPRLAHRQRAPSAVAAPVRGVAPAAPPRARSSRAGGGAEGPLPLGAPDTRRSRARADARRWPPAPSACTCSSSTSSSCRAT